MYDAMSADSSTDEITPSSDTRARLARFLVVTTSVGSWVGLCFGGIGWDRWTIGGRFLGVVSTGASAGVPFAFEMAIGSSSPSF